MTSLHQGIVILVLHIHLLACFTAPLVLLAPDYLDQVFSDDQNEDPPALLIIEK